MGSNETEVVELSEVIDLKSMLSLWFGEEDGVDQILLVSVGVLPYLMIFASLDDLPVGLIVTADEVGLSCVLGVTHVASE